MTECVAPIPSLPLTFGCVVSFEAINPSTGLPVAGVTVESVTLYGATEGASDDVSVLGDPGPFMYTAGPNVA